MCQKRLGQAVFFYPSLMLEAQKRGLILHASSGVAAFKRSRGAVPALEVNAVFDAHLPLISPDGVDSARANGQAGLENARAARPLKDLCGLARVIQKVWAIKKPPRVEGVFKSE